MPDKKEDYYKVLGVPKDANETQIKKAYRKGALKWHPDKNPDNKEVAEEVFKKLAEAYDVLSKPDKKKLYDRYGHAGLDPQYGKSGGNQGFDNFGEFDPFGGGGSSFKFTSGGYNDFTFDRANDIFKDFFGGQNDFFNDNDDDFFHNMGNNNKGGPGNKKPKANKNSGSGMMMQDPFNDDFFGGGGFGQAFGGFGGGFGGNMFADMDRHMSMGMGGSGGMGGSSMTSVSTSTVIRNGKKVSVTKKTTTQPDGSTKTEVTESVDDGKGNKSHNKYIPGGNRNDKY